ncbi:MAG TPA: GNAT family protein [Longimicrobium sp.]|jgi:RimJ/RimL family protein N-acetyltransferase|uniref:GNAT family N-acetyltransferase n=1 Tax=Longimicrobium sp. TaxID=2029185 RepID=UPI002ED9372F
MNVEEVELRGSRIVLEPLRQRHLPGLADAIRDGALWEIPVTLVPHPRDLPAFLADAEAQHGAGKELAFATVDLASGAVIGSTRFRNIEAAHARVEIGFTFIARSWQRTYANTEAKYLMLRHAFEHWRVNRVEFMTDALNAKSRAAIARIGAREEGVLRAHMIMRGGRVRDSAVFSIVAAEWPRVKQRLETMLA